MEISSGDLLKDTLLRVKKEREEKKALYPASETPTHNLKITGVALYHYHRTIDLITVTISSLFWPSLPTAFAKFLD